MAFVIKIRIALSILYAVFSIHVEAQNLNFKANNRKDRKPGVDIKDVLIRSATDRLERIRKEILELRS